MPAAKNKPDPNAIDMIFPGRRPKLVALKSGGHSISISNELPGTSTPKVFQKKALQLGCVPVAMYDPSKKRSGKEEGQSTGAERMEKIIGAIDKMTETAAESEAKEKLYFSEDGTPSAEEVSKMVGFKVFDEEIQQAMRRIQEDE